MNFDSTKYNAYEESKAKGRDPSKSELQREVRLTEEGRGYFCSELVVKAYKVCGILSDALKDEASSNFLPGDWSSAKDSVKLVEGASLGTEQLIFSGGMWEAEAEETGGLQMLRNVGNAIGLGPKKSLSKSKSNASNKS